MNPLFDAFWRAVAYCMHPRVMLWSVAPLLLAGGAVFALGWLYWEGAIASLRATMEQWALVASFMAWLDSVGGAKLHALMAPMILVALAVPLVVVLALVLVATLMTPAIVALVVQRRFPDLERRHGASWWQSLLWSLVCTVVALIALVLSIPLWFVPPLVLILPPLIWGWLTCRVFTFDVLAAHASAAERRQIVHEQRWRLLAIGIVCGYLGAAPSVVWALSAAALVFAPLLIVISVWLYTLVFVFAGCWFAHFALAELQRLRLRTPSPVPTLVPLDPSSEILSPPLSPPRSPP